MSSADWFFKDAIEARDELTKRQEKAIRKSYNEWAMEVREEANRLSRIPGSQNEQRQMAELYYQLRNASRQLSAEINNEVNSNVNNMGSVVVRTNQRWLSYFYYNDMQRYHNLMRIRDTDGCLGR